ncbi:FHA domain-containing protein [Arthrobacter sp. TMN-49]
MVSTTYSTGSWLGIVRSSSVIVLRGHTDPAIVSALWDFLGQKPTIHGVLDEVTRLFGTGPTSMPDFGIVLQSDRLHAILRGEMTLAARTGDATEVVSGRDVTTWSERSLPLPDSLELTLAQASEPAEPTLLLPVGEAVIRLQSLRVELAEHHLPETVLVADSESTELLADDAAAAAEPVAAVDDAVAAAAEPEVVEPAAEPPADAASAPEEASAEESASAASVPEEASAASIEEPASVEGGEGDDDAYASFAMAAEAADAEWNAQLAPTAAEREADMNLTIRPDLTDDEPFDAEPHDEDPIGDESLAEHQPDFAEAMAEDVAVVSDAAEDASFAAEPAGADSSEVPGEQPAGQEAAENGFTTNYDHLFGPTVARSVEDAAVRLDDDGQPVHPQPRDAVLPPLPALPPVAGIAAEVLADLSAASPAQSAEEQWQPEGLLIDSVPWGNHPGPEAGPEAGAETGVAMDAATGVLAAQPYDPDHDGHTVMRGDVGDVGADEAPDARPLESRPPTGPMVLARVCPNGHANPPSRSQCSDCGAAINSEPREVGRPRLGTMHISSGEVVELDHSLIIGRQPSVSRVMGGAMPRLVQVISGNDDISRSHVEVRLDGWDVLLVDLKATNGTVLVREGQAPRRLSQGEQAILLNGDIAELGDGISLLFEGLL